MCILKFVFLRDTLFSKLQLQIITLKNKIKQPAKKKNILPLANFNFIKRCKFCPTVFISCP